MNDPKKGIMKVRKTILVMILLLLLFSIVSCNGNESDTVFWVDTFCSEHRFGDWNVIMDPTTISEGLKQRTCQSCGFIETEKIPKNTFSYHVNENGEKFFEVKIPFNPQEVTQSDQVADSYTPIKIVVDEIEKIITVEGDALPPNTDIDDIKANIEQTLNDNDIIVSPDFDYDIKIPGYEDNDGLIPSPY